MKTLVASLKHLHSLPNTWSSCRSFGLALKFSYVLNILLWVSYWWVSDKRWREVFPFKREDLKDSEGYWKTRKYSLWGFLSYDDCSVLGEKFYVCNKSTNHEEREITTTDIRTKHRCILQGGGASLNIISNDTNTAQLFSIIDYFNFFF